MRTKRIKRQKVSSQAERQLITGMIVSDTFLRDIQHIYSTKLIKTPFAKTVASWCIDYYKRYSKAPQQHIEDIFRSHQRKNLDPERAELISDFLESVSEEYERSDKFNSRYVLDQIEEYFKDQNLRALSEDIQTELSRGNSTEAEALLGKYKRVSQPMKRGVNPFTDKEAIFNAFERAEERLFQLPGALGRLINNELVREGFLGLMGPEKRGKTFMLMEFAKRAARARCNTVFFGAGDMSQDPMIVRWHVSLTGRSNRQEYCGDIMVPVLDCIHNQTDKCNKKQRTSSCGVGIEKWDEPISYEDVSEDYEPCSACAKNSKSRFRGAPWYEKITIDKPLTWREGFKAGKTFMKRLKGRDFKLDCYFNNTLNVQKIKTQLEIWRDFDGWIPDVVVVDYADILAPESGFEGKDERPKQNETWKMLRSLSQEWHCLVITATQADAASYDAKTLRTKHFSEDKRKYGHVTGMLGLNQTEEEKEKGIMRINWLVRREGEFSSKHTVKVLQSLATGKPLIASYW